MPISFRTGGSRGGPISSSWALIAYDLLSVWRVAASTLSNSFIAWARALSTRGPHQALRIDWQLLPAAGAPRRGVRKMRGGPPHIQEMVALSSTAARRAAEARWESSPCFLQRWHHKFHGSSLRMSRLWASRVRSASSAACATVSERGQPTS